MSRTLVILISLVLFSATRPVHAKIFEGFPEETLGVSALFGEPSGGRVIYFSDWKQAWAFSGGYSFSKVFQFSVDYLLYGYQTKDRVADRDFWNSLIFYGGVGAVYGKGLEGSDENDANQAGIRAVGGTEYLFSNGPLSLRIELAPTLFAKAKGIAGFSVVVGATFYLFGDPDGQAIKKIYQIKSKKGVDGGFD
jgi:hypothetical protein